MTYANPYFLKTWGYDKQNEILGKCLTSLLKDEEQTRRIIRKVLSGNNTKNVEAIGERKDSSEFLAGLNSSQMIGPVKNPIGVTLSAADIS